MKSEPFPKILFVTQTRMYRQQGDTIHVAEVVQEMARCGASVILIASGKPIQPLDGVKYIDGGQVRPGPFVIRLITFLVHTLITLFHVFRFARQVDVLYTRDALLGFWLWLLHPLIGLPVVFEVNGLRGVEKGMYLGGKIGHLVCQLISGMESLIARHARALVCVTTGIRGILHQRYGIALNRMVVVPNGVNLQIFRPAQDKKNIEILKKSLNLRINDAVIFFVGGLKPWVDFNTLLQSVDSLQLADINPVLLIVGDGFKRTSIEARIRTLNHPERVVMTGAVPYHEVPNYIALADICTMPFTVERNREIGLSPLKLFSYLACGKPIVATKIDGFEFLEEEKMGSLVPIGDAEAFAVAMKQWLEKPVDREEQRMRIRTYAETHCGWDRTARQVLEVCKGVV